MTKNNIQNEILKVLMSYDLGVLASIKVSEGILKHLNSIAVLKVDEPVNLGEWKEPEVRTYTGPYPTSTITTEQPREPTKPDDLEMLKLHARSNVTYWKEKEHTGAFGSRLDFFCAKNANINAWSEVLKKIKSIQEEKS